MITTIPAALTAALCIGSGPSDPVPLPAVPDSTYRALYEAGQTFTDFVAAADSRKNQWEANFARQAFPDALSTRLAAAVAPGWKLLVITRAGCSDSVNSIPYLAGLLARTPALQMRLVSMSAGMKVLEAHRTPDGRSATPTVILLDANYDERGCWIERPAALIAWLAERKGSISESALFDGKMKWYDEDEGVSSLEEIVRMIEAASRGTGSCGARAGG